MAILQFAFGTDPQGPSFRPHNYPRDLVVYTGTHDNDTTRGWWTSAGAGDSTRSSDEVHRERDSCRRYLGFSDDRDVHWAFIRAVMASVADTAIVPLQDVLGLGSEARMNLPGRPTEQLALAVRGGRAQGGAAGPPERARPALRSRTPKARGEGLTREEERPMDKPRLGFWQIWNMSFGFLGIQFGWGLQMANMSAIYEYLGATADQIPMLWLAAPLTGLIVQPIIGAHERPHLGPARAAAPVLPGRRDPQLARAAS